MALQKILILDAGNSNLSKQYTPLQASSGSSSAGQIPALNASGLIDPSMIPNTASTISMTASEAIAAGAAVNMYDNAGTMNARNANGTDATKPFNGFAVAAIASGATGSISYPGQPNAGLSGLSAGPVYLGTTAGQITNTAPSATGNLVQCIGYALSATEAMMLWSPGIIY